MLGAIDLFAFYDCGRKHAEWPKTIARLLATAVALLVTFLDLPPERPQQQITSVLLSKRPAVLGDTGRGAR
jgi:hypothetical protein